MKHKMAATLLLAVVSSNAAAEWVAVGANDSSTIYADSATLAKAGDNARMWHLIDFNSVQTKATGKRYISERLHYEYDCKQARARMMSFLSHTGPMGRGVMVDGDWRPQKWEPVPDGSVIEYMRNLACGKR